MNREAAKEMEDEEVTDGSTPETAEERRGKEGGGSRAPKAKAGATSAEEGGSAEGSESSPEVEEEIAAETELQAELDHLEEEFRSLKDRHLRLAADFENYRKRARSEMSESWSRAQADLVRKLLDALDDLERVAGVDSDESSVESVLEGVELVERKLARALEEAGVEVLEPEGELFDPKTMEAMLRVSADSEEDDDRVEQVLQKGYLLGDHLIRPARVSVSKYDEGGP